MHCLYAIPLCLLLAAPVARADDAAIAKAIEKLGGQLTREGNSITEVSFEGVSITDDDLKQLKLEDLKGLKLLWLGRTKIGDSGLKEVGKLKSLRGLCLCETQIIDAGLGELEGLTDLLLLKLNFTRISDKGLKSLAPMKDLVPSSPCRRPGGSCPGRRL
ncbi:hypothetical protein AYO40_04780 [Planctomycetaceae bacterium SCGC AG-212-D15]|nr:hypothetical protein AYO40_04780 [Planctomycetaceae bacterium SCGC AG-212-D15]